MSLTNCAMVAAVYEPMTRISLQASSRTHASMWCWMSGSPATGNRGLGVSSDSGRKRVPVEPRSYIKLML